ncbi:MAG: endonuclease/exonuclease/phosphatase family protein [Pirellulales bacterium]
MLAIRFAFAVVSIAVLGSAAGAADGQPLELRVMSFNIRYGTAADGANHWDERKQFLVDTISRFDPDLLGTQETLGFQRDYLARQLPQYEVLGVGRDDGRDAGEMMALYYKAERFEHLDAGHFWLSETPDQPGSRSWDSSLPRMVTWVKLGHRDNATASPLLFFNTHFDHLGVEARLQSARLLRAQLAAIGDGCSLVVTGDFNTPEASPPYCALFDDADDRPSPLVDTYRLVHPVREADEGTFSGFRAAATAGPRIDWIGVSREWQVLEAGIDRTQQDGRTPSDHYPVTSLLRR